MARISLEGLLDADIAARWFDSDVTEPMRLQLLHTQQLRNQQQLLANQARLLAAVEADSLVAKVKTQPKPAGTFTTPGVARVLRNVAAKIK